MDFMVNQRSIKADPKNIKVILEIKASQTIKEV